MKYSVRFYNVVTKKVFCVLEMEQERITRRDWHDIVQTLFIEAASGYENRLLYADVYCCDASALKSISVKERGIFTVWCETDVDGSTITAHIHANGAHIRTMTIAC